MDDSRQALQFIAHGATELAGFRVVAISVVRDGVLETVAVAGDTSAAAELMELRTPVDLVLEEIRGAEEWGSLRFVPQERSTGQLDPFAWIPGDDRVDSPGAWDPDDLLVALLRDSDGALRGVLSVDVPADGWRPGPEQQRVLNLYAQQAEQAVVAVLEREEYAAGMARERALADYRSHLINVLSHELQNPVAAILGYVELLDDLEQDGAADEIVTSLGHAASRIDSMVRDLLRLARLGGVAQTACESSDLVEVARCVTESLGPVAHRAQIELEVLVATQDAWVDVSAGDARSVLENLVSNAIKYSDAGGHVSLEVGTSTDPTGTPWVEVVVQDDGIGIAEEEQERVLEEFFRSSSIDARRRPGTGLGLAIVNQVVTRQGGHLELRSRRGHGTRIAVRLPRNVH